MDSRTARVKADNVQASLNFDGCHAEILMKRLSTALLSFLLAAAWLAAQGRTKPLEIWVVDVEGCKAALYVSPTGQTAMIDTGFPGARDLDRIMAAIGDAGVE